MKSGPLSIYGYPLMELHKLGIIFYMYIYILPCTWIWTFVTTFVGERAALIWHEHTLCAGTDIESNYQTRYIDTVLSKGDLNSCSMHNMCRIIYSWQYCHVVFILISFLDSVSWICCFNLSLSRLIDYYYMLANQFL